MVQREFVSADRREMSPEGYKDRIEIFPIAPTTKTMIQHAEQDLLALGRLERTP